jgi:hypothetical protein
LADLRRGADALALTSFDLEQIYGEREAVQSILAGQYRWVALIPDFGPYNDDLKLYLPSQFGEPQPKTTQQTIFGDQIALLGYDLDWPTKAARSTLTTAFYWRAHATPDRAYTVFVQLLDANGVRVAGWDNPPCRGSCQTTTWLPGEYLRDEYTLDLTGLTPGDYTLHVGLYASDDGVRLPIFDDRRRSIGDSLEVAPILVAR